MPKSLNSQYKVDALKFFYLIVVTMGLGFILYITPGLLYSSLLAMIMTALLSPFVSLLERKRFSRGMATTLIFLIVGCSAITIGMQILKFGRVEWGAFKEKAPQNFLILIDQIRILENNFKTHYPLFVDTHPTDAVLKWGYDTAQWFMEYSPKLAKDFLGWMILVPLLTFIFLKDGREFRKLFFYLVPNRVFESSYFVVTEISTAISDYVRAKLVEASVLGSLVLLGLVAVHAPYALLLAVLAGISNIIPYIGPFIGAIPGILIAAFDSQNPTLLFSVTLIYFIANLVDAVLIFPLVVAKLIRLHPIILIISVIIGQHYYGLLGMLFSIPAASAIKVILQEIHTTIYEQTSRRHYSSVSTPGPII